VPDYSPQRLSSDWQGKSTVPGRVTGYTVLIQYRRLYSGRRSDDPPREALCCRTNPPLQTMLRATASKAMGCE